MEISKENFLGYFLSITLRPILIGKMCVCGGGGRMNKIVGVFRMNSTVSVIYHLNNERR